VFARIFSKGKRLASYAHRGKPEAVIRRMNLVN
jgi:hypothetical protein